MCGGLFSELIVDSYHKKTRQLFSFRLANVKNRTNGENIHTHLILETMNAFYLCRKPHGQFSLDTQGGETEKHLFIGSRHLVDNGMLLDIALHFLS